MGRDRLPEGEAKNEQLQIRISREDKAWLAAHARAQGKSVAKVVTGWIEDARAKVPAVAVKKRKIPGPPERL